MPDPDEAPRLHWWPVDDLPALLRSGQVTDAFTATGLLWYLHLAAHDEAGIEPSGSRSPPRGQEKP
jgi:hypothetical protein